MCVQKKYKKIQDALKKNVRGKKEHTKYTRKGTLILHEHSLTSRDILTCKIDGLQKFFILKRTKTKYCNLFIFPSKINI